MDKFSLESHDFIELNNLLKILGWCSSGGLAKALIADGQVKVDGNVELRKRCKIKAGQQVEFDGQKVKIS